MFGLENYIANDYTRALVILLAVFAFLKIFVFVVEKIILRFAGKTKTDIDDIVIKKTAKPFTLIFLLAGLWFAIQEVALPELATKIIYSAIYSVVIFVFAFVVYMILDLFITRAWRRVAIKSKSKFDESGLSIIRSILKVVWVAMAFLYALGIWGVQIGPFLAGLGIAGLAVALALQPTLSNIFSGLSMILDKSVRVNDLVYLEDGVTKGKILRVGIRSTKLLTFDNELVIIPNSKLADSKIQNVALPEPKARVVIPFGVAYGSDIEKVKKVVLKEIKTIANLVEDPEPMVRFLEMDNSSLNFKAYFYVDSFENRFAAIDEANTKIYNTLKKNKITIPFPQMDVHLKRE